MKIFKNTEYPINQTNLKGDIEEDFSVDVITCDESGRMNLGWWNYDTKDWSFHADCLCDMTEGGVLKEFVWMYKPEELKV